MDLQQQVLSNFSSNLEFLQKNDSKLFNKINRLSELINNCQYQERYFLEYIDAISEFNVYDKVNNEFLYENPKLYKKNAYDSVQFDNSNSYILLSERFYNKQTAYSKVDLKSKENNNYLYELHNDISQYVRCFNNLKLENKRYKKLDKFTFLGTALGIHIESIHKKLQSSVYFICDSDIELFRLSLFVVNYSKIARKSKVIFSISDDESTFCAKYKSFLHIKFESNYILKLYSTNFNIPNYHEKILAAYEQFNPTKYFYKKTQNLIARSSGNILKYKSLLFSSSNDLFNDKPVLVLGAGPSFGYSIEWLLENQDKFFIVAMAAVLNLLAINNIKPSLIITIDQNETTKGLFTEIVVSLFQNIPIIASSITSSHILDNFLVENIFIFEVMTQFIDHKRFYYVGSGDAVLFLLIKLGVKNIYLLGYDLAFDVKTGNSHFKGYVEDLASNTENSKNSICTFRDTLKVKGNFEEFVNTSINFKNVIDSIAGILSSFKGSFSISIKNLGNGAYIPNTIPMDKNDLSLNSIDKKLDTVAYLKNISMSQASSKKIKSITKSIILINSILESLKSLKATKVISYEDFFSKRDHLFKLMVQKTKEFDFFYISNVYLNFLHLTEPYIYSKFNVSVTNEFDMITDIKNIWIEQAEKISYDLIENLQIVKNSTH